MKYYAVRKGNTPGIYKSWAECQKQVKGYRNAEYKSFESLKEAERFMEVKVTEELKEDTVLSGLVAYVDGSYNPATKDVGAGFVLVNYGDGNSEPEVVHEMSYKLLRKEEYVKSRNVSGELFATMLVINYCIEKEIKDITIVHDYVGISAWALGNWSANTYVAKTYSQYIKSIIDLINIKFIKVKSHSSNYYNDRADTLAKYGIF